MEPAWQISKERYKGAGNFIPCIRKIEDYKELDGVDILSTPVYILEEESV